MSIDSITTQKLISLKLNQFKFMAFLPIITFIAMLITVDTSFTQFLSDE